MLAQTQPKSDQYRPTWAEVGQVLAKFDQAFGQHRPLLVGCVQILAESGHIGRVSAKIGKSWSSLGRLSAPGAIIGQLWATQGQLRFSTQRRTCCRMRAEFGRVLIVTPPKAIESGRSRAKFDQCSGKLDRTHQAWSKSMIFDRSRPGIDQL